MAAKDETYQLSLLIFWLMFCGVVPMRRANSLPLILYSSRRRRTSLETCILYHLFPGGLLYRPPVREYKINLQISPAGVRDALQICDRPRRRARL